MSHKSNTNTTNITNNADNADNASIPAFVAVRKLEPVTTILETDGELIIHLVGPFEFSWYHAHRELVRIRDTSAFGIDAWIRREELTYMLELHRQAVRRLPESEKIGVDTWDITRVSLGTEICGTLRTRGFWAPKDPASSDTINAVGIALDNMRQPLQEFADSQECSSKTFTSPLKKVDDALQFGKWASTDNELMSATRAVTELTSALQQMRDLVAKLLEAGHITKQ